MKILARKEGATSTTFLEDALEKKLAFQLTVMNQRICISSKIQSNQLSED